MENYKKLERNVNNKVIGGVCSGLADYFEIDTAIMRVLFAFLLLIGGLGLLIYLILWIALPARRDDSTYNQAYDSTTGEPENQVTSHSHQGNLIAGLFLVLLGGLFLLGNLIPRFNWHTYWPVVLIVLGLVLIIPFSSKKHS